MEDNSAIDFPRSARDKYIPFKVAGAGNRGLVYFALPIHDLPKEPPKSSDQYAALRQKLVAVKLLKTYSGAQPQAELDSIQNLQLTLASGTSGVPTAWDPVTRLLPWPIRLSRAMDAPWYAMRAIHGATLETLLEIEPLLPRSLVFWIFRELVTALATIRARGMMYTDLSPSNIMLHGVSGDTAVAEPLSMTLLDPGSVRPHTRAREEYACLTLLTVMHEVSKERELPKVSKEQRGMVSAADDFYFFVRAGRRQRERRIPVLALDRLWQGFAEVVEAFRRTVGVQVPDCWIAELAKPIMSDEELDAAIIEGGLRVRIDERG
ncbi:hypothetical protein BU26DRAFT_570489 [Trematosphaeria pertusa]|uniref:Protein kinase domain-containing protein n=1 Tax=Trematosphaeria pertusa TaxID=390896 RepID=A0A6A6HXZ2_9PLEO|nr:uncharacterized protein BU26DRAFT_570489 [Trematosphaeria pertusa]KAF2243084.1 hypothetical protein BU26DRAFT_570489 [Trematosphaeria pertusa]